MHFSFLSKLILTLYCVLFSVVSLCDPMDCSPPGSSVLGTFWNTGVGCHFLLQGIFPNRGLNQCLLQLLDCKWILYQCATLVRFTSLISVASLARIFPLGFHICSSRRSRSILLSLSYAFKS